jgi:hypothetical protein
MKTINLSDEDFEKLVQLSAELDKIYGDENTTWNFDDVDDMRQVGTEFIWLLSKYLEKAKNNA